MSEAICTKCQYLGDAAPCDECYFKGNGHSAFTPRDLLSDTALELVDSISRTPPAPPTKTGEQAVGEIKTRYKCGCCGQEFRPTGMLGGRLSCGCETAKCSVCGKCSPDHCQCEWGRPSQVEKIREFAKKRLVSPRYRFDEATGHIFDGDHAVAYSHVKQWGHELADALNTRTAEREALVEMRELVENERESHAHYVNPCYPDDPQSWCDWCDKAHAALAQAERVLAAHQEGRDD